MDPSTTATFPAPRTRGWDLPEEILHDIMFLVRLRKREEYGKDNQRARAKHALLAASLVNKYWAAAIRPLLFRTLRLRSHEDVLFLKELVCSPAFASSGLGAAIATIYIWCATTEVKQCVCHIHWLTSRLRQTQFSWYPRRIPGDGAPTPALSNPFAVIPRVLTSFLRLNTLFLDSIQLPSCAKLVKIIDSFPTLKHCHCLNIALVDPSPYVPPRWRQRQSTTRRPLVSCRIAATKDMTLAAQAALASDVVRMPDRLNLDDKAWRAVLNALVGLVPATWKQITLGLSDQDNNHFGKVSVHFSKKQTRSLQGGADAFVVVRQRDASSPSTELPWSADICQIVVTGSFPGMHVTGPTSLDYLHSENLAAVSGLERLGVWARPSNKGDLNGMKKILCAVLRRTQLSWALDSRRLEFIQSLDNKKSSVLSSASILSRPAEHIVGDKPVTLDIPEQAEWLLRFQPKNRNAYLWQLVAQHAATSTAVDIAHAAADNLVDPNRTEDDETSEE